MWIRTQNKQRIINSDQIVDIFVGKSGTTIMAETTRDGDFFTLGEYENRDTCMKILEALSSIATNVPTTVMPLGGEVDSWLKNTSNLAMYYIAKDFK